MRAASRSFRRFSGVVLIGGTLLGCRSRGTVSGAGGQVASNALPSAGSLPGSTPAASGSALPDTANASVDPAGLVERGYSLLANAATREAGIALLRRAHLALLKGPSPGCVPGTPGVRGSARRVGSVFVAHTPSGLIAVDAASGEPLAWRSLPGEKFVVPVPRSESVVVQSPTYAPDEEGVCQSMLRLLEARTLHDTRTLRSCASQGPAVSSDGRRIAYAGADGELRVTGGNAPAEGRAFTLPNARGAESGTFSAFFLESSSVLAVVAPWDVGRQPSRAWAVLLDVDRAGDEPLVHVTEPTTDWALDPAGRWAAIGNAEQGGQVLLFDRTSGGSTTTKVQGEPDRLRFVSSRRLAAHGTERGSFALEGPPWRVSRTTATRLEEIALFTEPDDPAVEQLEVLTRGKLCVVGGFVFPVSVTLADGPPSGAFAPDPVELKPPAPNGPAPTGIPAFPTPADEWSDEVWAASMDRYLSALGTGIWGLDNNLARLRSYHAVPVAEFRALRNVGLDAIERELREQASSHPLLGYQSDGGVRVRRVGNGAELVGAAWMTWHERKPNAARCLSDTAAGPAARLDAWTAKHRQRVRFSVLLDATGLVTHLREEQVPAAETRLRAPDGKAVPAFVEPFSDLPSVVTPEPPAVQLAPGASFVVEGTVVQCFAHPGASRSMIKIVYREKPYWIDWRALR